MMKARRGRFHQRQQMMVAAVDAVHERDQIAGAVGQAQAQVARVELHRGVDVAGEGQDVRQPARPYRRRLLPRRSAGRTARRRNKLTLGLLVRRYLGADLHLDQQIFMVAEPGAVAFEAGRRVDQLDAVAFDARLQQRQVVGVTAEREMMQRLGLGALHHRTPAMIVTESLDLERVAFRLHVEAERAVEILRHAGVGDGQHELVERMHTERRPLWSAPHSHEWQSPFAP